MSAHHHERTRQDVGGDDRSADVIVVGAGPAGSTAATYLARAGLDVLVLEKSEFPREKVCGDGLTPRAVKQLIDLGIDTREEAGWLHNKGLRVLGGGLSVELPWPELTSFPPYGLVRPAPDFDQMLADHARAAGARIEERIAVSGAVTDERTGRVVGVAGAPGPGARAVTTYTAPLVVACDGVGARTALSRGIGKRDDRAAGRRGPPLLHQPPQPRRLPRDPPGALGPLRRTRTGCCPATAGCSGWATGRSTSGSASWTSPTPPASNYRSMLRAWCESLPEEWGFTEENAVNDIGGAALPMGFNRTPVYADGLLLVGDAGGMVNSVQRRGHRLRHAVGRARRAGRPPGPGPPRRGRRGNARWRAIRPPSGQSSPATTAWATGSPTRCATPRLVQYTARHGLPGRRSCGSCSSCSRTCTTAATATLSDRLLELLLRLTPQLSDAPAVGRPARRTRSATGRDRAA